MNADKLRWKREHLRVDSLKKGDLPAPELTTICEYIGTT